MTFTKFFFFLLILFLGCILYTHRALFTSTFDEPYWKDKYEHSQWKLPLSQRTIGDDGLYLYEGYQLMQGADPTTLNAEVPPLGKYLIGATVVTFKNGHWYGFATTVLALIAFYLLASSILSSKPWAAGLTLLFAIDPLVTSQFPLTMLDSLQMAFGLFTLWILTKLITKPQTQYPIASFVFLGLSFGLFASTKAPIFSPFLGAIIALTLLVVYRSIKPHIIVFSITMLTYIATYLPYFFMGHSFTDWLKVQKWILQFYRGSYIQPNIGSAVTTLLFNQQQNLFTRVWEQPSHFSFAWPPLVALSILVCGLLIFKRTEDSTRRTLAPLAGFLILSLGFLSIIPFWTRYLLPILPLLYILAAYSIRSLPYKNLVGLAFTALIVANSVAVIPILFPTPEGTVKQAVYAWKYGYFQDLYEELTTTSRTTDRKTFHAFGLTSYAGAEIESLDIVIHPTAWKRFTKTQQAPLKITYHTRNLGSFTENRIIPLVKENGRWKVAWDWNLLIEGLTPTRTLTTTIVPAKRGTIIASTIGKPVAQDVRTVLISVVPNNVDKTREDAMFKKLETLFEGRASAISLHERAVGNTLGTMPVPLGILPFSMDANLQKELLSYPGILLSGAFGRQWSPTAGIDTGKIENTQYHECCSYLYSTTAYDGVSGLEKQWNETLKGYNGGSLVITDESGKIVRTILSVEEKDGEDIAL